MEFTTSGANAYKKRSKDGKWIGKIIIIIIRLEGNYLLNDYVLIFYCCLFVYFSFLKWYNQNETRFLNIFEQNKIRS